jgi:hypothetical protein
MQKRPLVVGAVMLASALSYGVVQMTEASPAVGVTSSSEMTSATTPVLQVAPSSDVATLFGSLSDTTTLLAAGVTLLGIAAGVRRHTC